MRYAPPLRNIKAKHLRKLCCSLTCDGISPCPKWHKQIIILVKRQIAVHHAGNTDCRKLFDGNTILFLCILRHFAVAVWNALPNHIQAVCPDAVHKHVFPIMGTCGYRSMILPDKHRLYSGRTELYSEHSPAAFNNTFYVWHNIPPPCNVNFWIITLNYYTVIVQRFPSKVNTRKHKYT